MRTRWRAAWFLAVLGAASSSGQPLALRAAVPSDIAVLSLTQLNGRALAEHGRKNYGDSAMLFYYETLLWPDAARGWFNLACALSLLGETETAVIELRQALEKDHAWTAPRLADHDLDPIRNDPGFAELSRSGVGRATAPAGPASVILGSWRGPQSSTPLPPQLPAKDGAWPSAAMELRGDGRFVIGAAGAYEVRGHAEQRGPLVFWWGDYVVDGEGGPDMPPPPFKSGILSARLAAAGVLDVEYVAGDELDGAFGYFVVRR